MKFSTPLIAGVAISLLLIGYNVDAAQHNPAVVPLPQQITIASGNKVFDTNNNFSICTEGSAIDSISSALDILKQLKEDKSTDFGKCSQAGNIRFKLVDTDSIAPEAYKLDINEKCVDISASSAAGFFYAVQTLAQLISTSPDGNVKTMSIIDSPRFEWRGFMLDEGRHFFGKREVKKILDIMAIYKLNRLHWHLTEDQGWRIEIKKYPKLTEVGAWRMSEKLGSRNAQPEMLDHPYGGYYTQDDIREIVEYAAKLHIQIVPEIDIPGHTRAAIAAYPEILACDPDSTHNVWLYQGVTNDVMNVASPAAVNMAKDIIDEVIKLFPFGYLHLGGDECPTDKWEKNTMCKERLKALGSNNYRDLQIDFYRQLQNHINNKGPKERRRLIFWNEVLHGDISMLQPGFMIMSWIGTKEAEKAALEAATNDIDVIMTPQIPYYINRKQSTAKTEPMSQGEGKETVEAVYAYRPVEGVADSLRYHYKGVQANFWSEHVATDSLLEYLMLPRLAAVAEAAWTQQPLREWNDFKSRIQHHELLYLKKGYNYAPHIFDRER